MEVVPIALEDLMLGQRQEDIEVARRPAIETGLAFSGQSYARSFFHARRNIDRQRPFLLHMTAAAARLAGIADNTPGPMTIRTSTFDSEKALLRPDFPCAGTGRTLFRPRTCFRSAAAACLAGDGRVDANFRGLAGKGILKRDLHVVTKIVATILPAPSLAAHQLAEKIVEHVSERRSEVEAETIWSSTAAILERRMAEAVI